MIKRLILALSIFNFTLFLSMRSVWSGIQKMFGLPWLQFFILGLLAALAMTLIVFEFVKVKRFVIYIFGGLSIIFFIALAYMAYLGIGSNYYIIRSFGEILMYLIGMYFIYFIIFKFPKCRLYQNKLYKISLIALIFLFIIVMAFDLEFHYVTNEPVVYAVEDTYQIVWTTSTDAVAQVRIGNKTYYDTYAGSSFSETTVHKVTVPMSELDHVKEYSIKTTHMLFRGPYSAVKGGTSEKAYDFIPVDLSDGLNYYTVSDVHEYPKSAIEAASYFGDALDFLIISGDVASHMEETEDLEIVLRLGHAITKGQKPVVFARGNHDVKSNVADQLHRYVGSLNEKFYYTYTLSGVFGVVLDLGEDHSDSWWEFYGTAHYDAYRVEQTAFLNDVYEAKAFEAEEILYKMAVCHIPVTLITTEHLGSLQMEWTAILNLIDIDVMISGHKHQLVVYTTDIPPAIQFDYHDNYWKNEPAGIRTAANFDNFVATRRSDVQDIYKDESEFGLRFTGLAVSLDVDTMITTIRYTNQDLEIVPIVHPYTGVTFTEFIRYLDTSGND